MIDEFRKHFGAADGVRFFRAPGRVNLIGEHTDYNLGFVMPVALHLATTIATAPSSDGKARFYSMEREEMREFNTAEIPTLAPRKEWTDYPIGVAQELAKAGVTIEPANFLIRSTVPEGSGLSSSAALEVSSALAFLKGRAFDKLELAKLCQRAERGYVGMPSGIMDQYVSVFGKKGLAVEIDCRSLGHRMVKLPDGIVFIAVNTMVKHELSGSAYRDRVKECAAAVEGIKKVYPSVESLRDVSPEQFEKVAGQLDDVIRRRARHVVTEDARVNRFVEAAEKGDTASMGKLMVESHRSLQHDYEVSCAELDFLVDTALGLNGVLGSRMTGGGFGGCTVTLLRAGSEQGFQQTIADAYRKKFNVEPAIYPVEPSDGAAEVSA